MFLFCYDLNWLPRYSAFGGLEMKFAICLDDNNILVDNFANNSIDGKINKRDYGNPRRPSKAAEKSGKRKNVYDLRHSFHEFLSWVFLFVFFDSSSLHFIMSSELYARKNITAYFSDEHLPLSARYKISEVAYNE